jgi:hypothetical protein
MLANNPKMCLWIAVQGGNLEMVIQCASLMGNDKVDWNWCMAMAASVGSMSIVKYAESMGTNIWNWFMGANNWNMCMAYAAWGGHLSIVEYAAARGANNWDWCMELADRRGHSQVKAFLEQCKKQQLNKN